MHIITYRHIDIWREIQKNENCGNLHYLQFYYSFCYKYCAVKMRNAKNVFDSSKNKIKIKREKKEPTYLSQLFSKSQNFLSLAFFPSSS